jgi:hypothetical protein
MLATIIIPISNNVPVNIINNIIAQHHLQTIALNIIISVHGIIPGRDLIHAQVVQREYLGDFSLAKTRNAGAWVCDTDWLIFSDIDITYDNDVLERMLAFNYPAVAGTTRCDIKGDNIEDVVKGNFYQCSNSPLIIKRSLFEEIGGYNEDYKNYGHEDSDTEHKITDLQRFDSNACHLMSIHNVISSPNWKRGQDTNKQLFFDRLKIPLEERRQRDGEIYFKNKKEFLNLHF